MKTQGEPQVRRVAIAGASGYTGVELLRFLVQHPAVRVVAVTAETHANQPISQVFPNLKGFVDLTCLPLDPAALAREAEFVFLALPHKASMSVGAELRRARGAGAGLERRLPAQGSRRPTPRGTGSSIRRPRSSPRRSTGCPSCIARRSRRRGWLPCRAVTPRAPSWVCRPSWRAGLVDAETIVVDSISGVSGAGRKPELPTHYLRGQREPEGLRCRQAPAHTRDRAGTVRRGRAPRSR